MAYSFIKLTRFNRGESKGRVAATKQDTISDDTMKSQHWYRGCSDKITVIKANANRLNKKIGVNQSYAKDYLDSIRYR